LLALVFSIAYTETDPAARQPVHPAAAHPSTRGNPNHEAVLIPYHAARAGCPAHSGRPDGTDRTHRPAHRSAISDRFRGQRCDAVLYPERLPDADFPGTDSQDLRLL